LLGLATSASAQYCGPCNYANQGYLTTDFYNVDVINHSVNIRILDIPGQEQARYYVNAYFQEENHIEKVPVINGYLPAVKIYRNSYGNVSEVVYSYSNRIRHVDSICSEDGYIHYKFKSSTNDVTPAKDNKPNALKAYDYSELRNAATKKIDDRPSALKSDSQKSTNENKPNGIKIPDSDPFVKTKETIRTPSADEKIDGLLNRPSSVKDSQESIPNYDR
jgi:hypothetical protein